ncbi:probable serine/threonine-protein kinase PIX13 [Punica granatum]|uniref:non-specific serine/threonine protein kinase n=1 Tax=Punica granatum TaxID=22663 RepID=A0A218X8A8_PUNGR|nr:probable serine/threonine-protein kinase PIX13 [Punica granatum]OWM81177.1 hypothetical protein CDL15_Pgr007208 [Punica granatum]
MGNYCCCHILQAHQVNHHISPNPTKTSSPGGSSFDKDIKQLVPTPARTSSGNGKAPAEGTTKQPVPVALPPVGKVITPNLRTYTLAELKSATRNFRPDTMLGEGGFGRVFKGWVDEKTFAPAKVGVGIPVAVKKSNPDSEQGMNEWQAEVKFLGKFLHPNLVKLIGYCWEDKHYLLVYEYMQKGSLENYLFKKCPEPLPWDIRIKIAIGAARGLAFLHTTEKSVIYRDFKSSNILLDGDYNAKLSDFGLAKLGPANGNSHVTTQVMGTYGYAAPEYVATGHLYVKSDVYGFGVVLLEMLTGLQALDMNRPTGETNLVEWAKPLLSKEKQLKKIMDPRFDGQYPMSGALQAAELILKCLEGDPKNRPSMDEVLAKLVSISSIKEKLKESKSANRLSRHRDEASSSSHKRQHQHHRSPLHHQHGGGSAGSAIGRGPRKYQHHPTARSL